MKNRRNAGTNGKEGMDGKDLYYELEFFGQAPSPQPKRRRSFPRILGWSMVGIAVGLAVVASFHENQIELPQSNRSSQAEAFRWAVNRAMSAAELTQKAASAEDWRTVAKWWQESIDLMKSVPSSHPKYQVAQSRLPQYEQNLTYAQSKVNEANGTSSPDALWAVGSRRGEVISLQGAPKETDRYDSMCKEVLHYGRSAVELRNGVVLKYEDFDRNLRARSGQPVQQKNASYWSLGASKEHIFAIQGTPSRVMRYDYSSRELLYYGNSTIDITDNRVTGFNNLDNNLRVQVTSLPGNTTNRPFWTLNSPRDDIFRIQGTPTQVILDNSTCTETLFYGNSSIDLNNGFIAGYDNVDRNLRVSAQ
ncbi:MAG TPA: hypothetical protein V6D10_07935 [Trichocoleus sp.]|jgi:hypothetical protein